MKYPVNKVFIQRLCLTALVLALPALNQAQQFQVTHSSAGLVLSDDFETDTVDTQPEIGVGDTGDTWIFSDANLVTYNVVDSSSPISAPTVGQALCVCSDGSVGHGGAALFGQTFSTGTLTANFSFFVPSDNGSGSGALSTSVLATFNNSVGTDAGSASAETWSHFTTGFWMADEAEAANPAGVNADDGVVGYFDGSWNYATSGGTPFTFTLDEWHDAEMVYNLDTSAVTISVDGTSIDGNIPLWQNAIGDAAGFLFRQNSGRNTPNLALVGGAPLVPGDVDGDGNVDTDDFDIIRMNYGMTDASLSDGDLTFDTVVDLFDFKEWKANCCTSAIPEPSGLVLLVMAATIALVRQRGGQSK